MRQQEQKQEQKQKPPALPVAGFHVDPWCRAAGISRPTYYSLPEAAKPRSVKVGDRRLILETPAAWLERIEQAGGVTIPRKEQQAQAA